MNVRALPTCKNPVGEGANLTLSIWKAQYNKGRGKRSCSTRPIQRRRLAVQTTVWGRAG